MAVEKIDPYGDDAIVITVEGGVIQDVEGIPPGVTVRVLDFDTEGCDEDTMNIVNDKGERAIVSEYSKPANCRACGREEGTSLHCTLCKEVREDTK